MAQNVNDSQVGGEMSFWGHLQALRSVLLRIAVVVVALAIGFFFIMPWFFDHVILWPCRADFPLYRALDFMQGEGRWMPDMGSSDFSIQLINIKLGTQLMTHFSSSLWVSLSVAFPLVVYMLWRFVSPGLYEKEKRGARKAFLFGNGMFYLGTLTGYFVVYPLALRFLSQYSLSEGISNQLTLDSYMDSFYTIVVSMGLVFELPLVAWMLGKMGLIDRSFFTRNRRYAIFGLLVLAALITPTSDIFTLTVVFIPLYGLWEFGAFLVPRADDDEEEKDTPATDTGPE